MPIQWPPDEVMIEVDEDLAIMVRKIVKDYYKKLESERVKPNENSSDDDIPDFIKIKPT